MNTTFLQQLRAEARSYSHKVGSWEPPPCRPCAEKMRAAVAAASVPVCPHRSPALAVNLYLCNLERPIRKVPAVACRRCGGKP